MIRFEKDTHKYFNEKEKELISVTKLMQQYGLSPDYSFVSDEVLKLKAERGTLIHKEIEEYIKNNEIGFTSELQAFIRFLNYNKAKVIASERIVNNDIVAGTTDLLLEINGERTIAEIKTTSSVYKEAVSWQLSIYNYLDDWKSKKAICLHFDADGTLKTYDINFKPKELIEELLEAYRTGKEFKLPTVAIPDKQLALLHEATAIIAEADRTKKEAEAKAAEVKEAIIKAMEEHGVKSFENDDLRITYIAPTTRATIDSTRLKQELPEIAEKYTKTSDVKSTVKITLKD